MSEIHAIADCRRHRYPPASIRRAVWRYWRFARSYRDVEEPLGERGVIVLDETVCQWCQKFGHACANGLRRHRPWPGDEWHPDEIFIRIYRWQHYPWRAVDQDGNVPHISVQSRRNKQAAKKFFRRLGKDLAYVPRVLSTGSTRGSLIGPRTPTSPHGSALGGCGDARVRAMPSAYSPPTVRSLPISARAAIA